MDKKNTPTSVGNSSPTDSTVPTPAPTTPSPRERAEQNRRIADDIAGAKRLLQALDKDTAVRERLSARKFGKTKIDSGKALQKAAASAFGARQSAIGTADACVAKLSELDDTARETYAGFRKFARKVFKTKADQAKLGLTGRVPNDQQQFITIARASYEAAGEEPFAAKFADEGYPAEAIEAELDLLDELDAAATEKAQSVSEGTASTKARNTAHGRMMDWVGKFRQLAAVTFRKEPEQLKKLDF